MNSPKSYFLMVYCNPDFKKGCCSPDFKEEGAGGAEESTKCEFYSCTL